MAENCVIAPAKFYSWICGVKTDKSKKLLLTRARRKILLATNIIVRIKKFITLGRTAQIISLFLNFAKSATLDEIREKDFSLAPSKYIAFIDHDLEIDYPA